MDKEYQAHVGVVSKQSRMSSSVQNLKQFVNDRLAAAAEEIVGVFQQTVSELENELNRQRELLDVLTKKRVVHLHNKDVQQLQVTEQEDSPELECRPGLEREEPEPPHKKDKKQVDVVLVQVKIEDEDQREEESSTSSLIQHMKREAAEDNCAGSETELHTLPQPDHQRSLYYESDTDDSVDWGETSDNQSGSNTEENLKVRVSEKKDDAEHKSLICSGCERHFSSRVGLTLHLKSCCESLTCWVCGKCFEKRQHLELHMKIHCEENLFTCSFCGKCFRHNKHLKKHRKIHTGEKPFTCSYCGKCFRDNWHLKDHVRVHTGEKPFSCTLCHKSFRQGSSLQKHMNIHNR